MTNIIHVLKPLDQKAIRCAIAGEVWAIDHVAQFSELQREFSNALIGMYFPKYANILIILRDAINRTLGEPDYHKLWQNAKGLLDDESLQEHEAYISEIEK